MKAKVWRNIIKLTKKIYEIRVNKEKSLYIKVNMRTNSQI